MPVSARRYVNCERVDLGWLFTRNHVHHYLNFYACTCSCKLYIPFVSLIVIYFVSERANRAHSQTAMSLSTDIQRMLAKYDFDEESIDEGVRLSALLSLSIYPACVYRGLLNGGNGFCCRDC